MKEVELECNWKLAPSHCLYERHIDAKGLDRHKQYGLLLELSPHPLLSALLVGPRDLESSTEHRGLVSVRYGSFH
jgi:hypothetical protein